MLQLVIKNKKTFKFFKMKNNLFIIMLICIALFALPGYSQLKVNSSGMVGINNSTPTYHLDVDGTFNFEQSGTSRIVTQNGTRIIFYNSSVYTDNDANLGTSSNRWYQLYAYYPYFAHNPTIDSDRNLKTDIQNLDNTLGKLKQLRPVTYKLLSNKGNNSVAGKNTPQVGLIAQEVQEIFPEVIAPVDSNILGIRYADFVPILIKGLQEQQEEIELLSGKINTLEVECFNNGNLKSARLSGDLNNSEFSDVKLFQNAPNPFTTETSIRFELPESVQDAQLHICDMTGTLLKSVTINQRGTGKVIINANEFSSGMYLYSLSCNGVIVDTKQMLLTD